MIFSDDYIKNHLKEIEKDSWLESQHIYQGGLGI